MSRLDEIRERHSLEFETREAHADMAWLIEAYQMALAGELSADREVDRLNAEIEQLRSSCKYKAELLEEYSTLFDYLISDNFITDQWADDLKDLFRETREKTWSTQ